MVDREAVAQAFDDARKALRAALVRAGLSQRELAELMGLHQTTLSRALSKADPDELVRVALVFPPALRVLAQLHRRLAAIYDLEYCDYLEEATDEADAAVDEIEQIIAARRERAKRDV